MKRRVVAVVGAQGFLAAMAFGQLAGESVRLGPAGQFTMSASFNAPRFGIPAVTGAPYSAEQVFETTQTLADGTRIVEESSAIRLYRDSAGRTRTERPFMGRPGRMVSDLPLLVEINDPVAGVRYILDTVNRIAHRSVLPPPGPANRLAATGTAAPGYVTGWVGRTEASAGATAAVPGGYPRPEVSSQTLGAQVIDGVVAEGRLTTMTHPAGAMGNDRPIVTTSEVWTSPELRTVVLAKSFDPRRGESVMRLTNVSRSDPDLGLFQPPPDYQIVDETGPFTITITRP